MKLQKTKVVLLLAALLLGDAATVLQGQDFLTPDEIRMVQDAQEIDARVKVYLKAASLRLKTAEDRLTGKESAPGDPLEFFSVEDMIDGYYRILRSVMYNLDDAYQKPATDRDKLKKALENLKDSTEKSARELKVLKKIAEQEKKERLWNLVNRAADITEGAHEGAESGLKKGK